MKFIIFALVLPFIGLEAFWWFLIDPGYISQRTEGDRIMVIMLLMGLAFVLEVFGLWCLDNMNYWDEDNG